MLAKVMVHAQTRDKAIEDIQSVISTSRICGPPTNLELLQTVLASDIFHSGCALTTFLDKFSFVPSAIEVIKGGAYTLVQDLGRPKVGHGIPRAGAMDPVAHQIANMLVGNSADAESLEITLEGPELLFHAPAVIALTGASAVATVEGQPMPPWTRKRMESGQQLRIGKIQGNGCRLYLAVYGGFANVAEYFDSKSTSPLVGIGGYQGRQLAPGDLLSITQDIPDSLRRAVVLDSSMLPEYKGDWELLCMAGPYSHTYLLPEDQQMIYDTEFKVSHNASRAGIRLIGPGPKWARTDGLHFLLAF